MNRTHDPASRARLGAALILALALSAAGCRARDGSADPFKRCPSGQHRVRDVTRPPARQWVCSR